MSRDIEALPGWAKTVAYSVLSAGWLASWVFILWYGFTRPWYRSEMGRHLMSMSAAVGAFFTLYLLLAIWPMLPGRTVIRFVLMIILVGTVIWRLIIFARQAQRDRRARD